MAWSGMGWHDIVYGVVYGDGVGKKVNGGLWQVMDESCLTGSWWVLGKCKDGPADKQKRMDLRL